MSRINSFVPITENILCQKYPSFPLIFSLIFIAAPGGMIRHPDVKFAYKDRNFSRTKFIIKSSFVKNLLFCKSLYFTTCL